MTSYAGAVLVERCLQHLPAAKLAVHATEGRPLAAAGGYACGCGCLLFCAQTAFSHATSCIPSNRRSGAPTLQQWSDAFDWIRANLVNEGALLAGGALRPICCLFGTHLRLKSRQRPVARLRR